jgi:hypothetical protein
VKHLDASCQGVREAYKSLDIPLGRKAWLWALPCTDSTSLKFCSWFDCCTLRTNTERMNVQALFRKIAAALPGMESLSAQKQEDLVDVNLTPGAQRGGASGAASTCQC